jgi:hypothetical protein
MKTVLAPGAPWPNWEQLSEQPKEKKPYRAKPRERIKPLAISGNVLDFFAETREQLASGKAKRSSAYDHKKNKSD